MNGAETLVRILIAGGIDTCFANPGTSEMHFVAALDKAMDMRCVLCLFEGGATGAADGYYRMRRKSASTLLHLGPGLANGIANLHNAKKAHSGIMNIVGEHATSHLKLNAPLTSDIEGLAKTVSHWVKTAYSKQELSIYAQEAIRIANSLRGQIATLILPGDIAWNEATVVKELKETNFLTKINQNKITKVANSLREAKKPLIIVGGLGLQPDTLKIIAQISEVTQSTLVTEWANARFDRGAGFINVSRIPYSTDQALNFLKNFDSIILIDARPPIGFFAYPEKPGILTDPKAQIVELTDQPENLRNSVECLSDMLGAGKVRSNLIAKKSVPNIPAGKLDANSIGFVIGALLKENSIVVDEAVTTGRQFFPATSGSPPHTWLNNCGGSIGSCLPLAVGAAIACPDRKVIALSGDGSAMYTVQSLWTIARESLDVTILIFANRTYKILFGELTNVGVDVPGQSAKNMLSLNSPTLEWVSLAKGMGVDALRVTTTDEFFASFQKVLGERGPFLIELVM